MTTPMQQYLNTGAAAWDSPAADVIGDMRRFIAAERERVYQVPASYDPLVLPPAYLDEYRQWCAHVYGTEDTELKRRAAERLNLHPGVRGLLSTRDVLTCEAAIDELRRSL